MTVQRVAHLQVRDFAAEVLRAAADVAVDGAGAAETSMLACPRCRHGAAHATSTGHPEPTTASTYALTDPTDEMPTLRMTLLVRAAEAHDVDAVTEVHARARASYYGSTQDASHEWRPIFTEAVDATETALWVALDDADVAGLALTAPTRYDDLDSAAVGQVYQLDVDPHRWSVGIGSRLLAVALDDLRRRGFRESCLEVWSNNQRAREFYTRHGWRPDGFSRSGAEGTDYLRYRFGLRPQ